VRGLGCSTSPHIDTSRDCSRTERNLYGNSLLLEPDHLRHRPTVYLPASFCSCRCGLSATPSITWAVLPRTYIHLCPVMQGEGLRGEGE
jgi:hypothetical protein